MTGDGGMQRAAVQAATATVGGALESSLDLELGARFGVWFAPG
jgi:hypothetical protein